jgi:adenosine deaminase
VGKRSTKLNAYLASVRLFSFGGVVNFAHLPKIELHCHLDACIRVETAADIARELRVKAPEPLRAALMAPELCADLADYLTRIEFAVQLMQMPEHLFRIAYELVEAFAADGVIYGEIRFAPQLHLSNGLSLQQVLDAVHSGLVAARKKYDIGVGLILCCLRHQPLSMSLDVVKLALANPDKVCAVDLAGDEARYPGSVHGPAFKLAKDAGLHRTIHAGEAAGPNSVREALDTLFAERVGHGVRIEQDPALIEQLRVRSIPLEMCPKSNVQTRAVSSLAAHPIGRLLRQGLRVTVNTDCRTTSDTSISGEFDSLQHSHGWGLQEFWRCQKNAAEAVFAPESTRSELLRRISDAEAALVSPMART